jgi:hypothetical protein
MFGRDKKVEAEKTEAPTALKDAVREARIEAAERSGVVVDLRDAEVARLEQDTRYGRAVLAESYEVRDIVQAITDYVARRLVERERALADDTPFGQATAQKMLKHEQRRGRLRAIRTFIYGVIIGVGALFVLALLNRPHP